MKKERNKKPDFSTKTLLIVDDTPSIVKALLRLIERLFDEVHTASTAAQAESILSERTITHLIVDFDLGPDTLNGPDLVPIWRVEYPQIERAIVFTGTALWTFKVPPQVDAVISKDIHAFDALICALGE